MVKKQSYFGLFVLVLLVIFLIPSIKTASAALFNVEQDDSNLTVEEFLNRVNRKDKPVLVYFHADWCVPCIKLKPVVEEVKSEQKDNCEVVKLDVEANPKVATYFEINTLPVFMIYKDGKKVMKYEGTLSKKEIISRIASNK